MCEKVTVIVLVWNGEKYLESCFRALLAQEYKPFEVLVVDNASTDGSVAIVQKYAPQVRLVRNIYNLGYSAGNNVGIEHAEGNIVVLLNQDTIVQPGWLQAIAETFKDPTIGIVGCKSFYMDGNSFQHAGGIVRSEDAFTSHIGWGEIDHGQYDQLSEPDFVTGAAFAIHRDVLNRLGKLDEDFYPGFYEEVDYCFRARSAGFRVVYQPRAVLLHHETTSLPRHSFELQNAFHRNRIRFVLRHWSMEGFEAFQLAEQQAISVELWLDNALARARAYWDNLLALPLIAHQRRIASTLGVPFIPGETRWLIGMLQTLRQQSQQRAIELMTPLYRPVEPSPVHVSMPSIEEPSLEKKILFDRHEDRDAIIKLSLQELDSASFKTTLQDLDSPLQFSPDLDSRVPVVGGLISWLRRFFVVFAVRPYVLYAIDQQSRLNGQVKNALDEIQHAASILQKQLYRLQQQNDVLMNQNNTLATQIQRLSERDNLLAQQNETLARQIGDLIARDQIQRRLYAWMNDDVAQVSIVLESIINEMEKTIPVKGD